jgi:hypothetical protein
VRQIRIARVRVQRIQVAMKTSAMNTNRVNESATYTTCDDRRERNVSATMTRAQR